MHADTIMNNKAAQVNFRIVFRLAWLVQPKRTQANVTPVPSQLQTDFKLISFHGRPCKWCQQFPAPEPGRILFGLA